MKCPDCDSELTKKDHEVFCPNCGLVVDDIDIDTTGEFRTDGNGELISQHGAPLSWLNPDGGTSSLVGNKKEYWKWKKKSSKHKFSTSM